MRIGHCFITHTFLLKGEEQSVCIGCDEHIEIRERHFTAQSLRVLLQDLSPEEIFFFFFKKSIFLEKI